MAAVLRPGLRRARREKRRHRHHRAGYRQRLFAVIAGDLEHNIAHPREIRVDAALDQVREIVDPLLLPPQR
jgi:hypothetical protein